MNKKLMFGIIFGMIFLTVVIGAASWALLASETAGGFSSTGDVSSLTSIITSKVQYGYVERICMIRGDGSGSSDYQVNITQGGETLASKIVVVTATGTHCAIFTQNDYNLNNPIDEGNFTILTNRLNGTIAIQRAPSASYSGSLFDIPTQPFPATVNPAINFTQINLTGLSINLLSPNNDTSFTNPSIDFVNNVSDPEAVSIANVTINVYFTNGTLIFSETNSSGIEGNYSWNSNFPDGNYRWNVTAFDGDSDFVDSQTRTFTVDSNAPSVDLFTPNETFNYLKEGGNLFLTGFANDTNLDSCWYDYNGTNTTFSCASTTLFNETISQATNNDLSLIVYANDSSGNLDSEEISWNYKIFENSRTFNATAYETSSENYIINLSSNSSLTSVILQYDNTEYTTTQSGNIYTRNLNLDSTGNKTFRWRFAYASETIYSDNSSQQVNPIQLGLCNATLTVPYINFSFKDEDDLSDLNATIPTSTFVYYLGDGTANKTLTFVNNTENPSYDFCFNPGNQSLNINPVVQYAATDYPQRIYDPSVTTYTNSTTETTLYLLSELDGIFVTYQVLNTVDQAIEGAQVTLTRTISGETVTVANGLTGADGTITFWLNPDFEHQLTISKSGFDTFTTGQFPTQTSYTILLQGAVSTVGEDFTKGINTFIYPQDRELFNDTSYNFIFNLTSSFWEIDSFGFSLRLSNGTIVGTGISTTTGSGANFNYDVGNQSIIYMDYYWVINGNFTNSSTYWVVTNTELTSWSIKTFFEDLVIVLDSEVFGLDNFGRLVITFLVLFISVGIFSYKFGFTSPIPLSILTFTIVYFLDRVVGLIPAIRGIDYLVTYVAGLIVAVAIISEVAR